MWILLVVFMPYCAVEGGTHCFPATFYNAEFSSEYSCNAAKEILVQAGRDSSTYKTVAYIRCTKK